jgi:hypothetical protein
MAVIPPEAAAQVSTPMDDVNEPGHETEPTAVSQNPKKKRGKKAANFQPKTLSATQKRLLQLTLNHIRVRTLF